METIETKDKVVNRRQFFRVEHSVPICATMSLYSVKGKIVATRSTYVCIQNIGPGGLCFWSDLSLPIVDTAIYSFKLTILESNLTLYGIIVRSKPISDNLKEYGVKFTEEENNNLTEITKIMNQWSIALRKKKTSELKYSCSLCNKKSIEDCFSSRNNKK